MADVHGLGPNDPIALLMIAGGLLGVAPIAAQQAPQVVFDSALVAEAFAQFALVPYRPLAIEPRYWTPAGRPGIPIGTESMQVLTRLISATSGRAEDLLNCPSELPEATLHPQCSLRDVGALLVLSSPEQLGDTVRQKVTVVLAGERRTGRGGEIHRILMWFLPSSTEWRVIQREVVWTVSRSP
jgi:hypothetical protein